MFDNKWYILEYINFQRRKKFDESNLPRKCSASVEKDGRLNLIICLVFEFYKLKFWNEN